jgi:dephospho-CoA kinase
VNFRKTGSLVIGLSGGIASGKSTVLKIFEELGAEIICSDNLAAQNFDLLKDKIKAYFNTDEKEQIAKKIFKNAQDKKWLEKLLHPLVLKEAESKIKQSTKKIIVFDIPLLFECGLEDGFDLTLCVYTDFNIRLKRALSRKMTKQDFINRDKAQISLEEKAQRADLVVFNNSTRRDLQEKIEKLFLILKNK